MVCICTECLNYYTLQQFILKMLIFRVTCLVTLRHMLKQQNI